VKCAGGVAVMGEAAHHSGRKTSVTFCHLSHNKTEVDFEMTPEKPNVASITTKQKSSEEAELLQSVEPIAPGLSALPGPRANHRATPACGVRRFIRNKDAASRLAQLAVIIP